VPYTPQITLDGAVLPDPVVPEPTAPIDESGESEASSSDLPDVGPSEESESEESGESDMDCEAEAPDEKCAEPAAEADEKCAEPAAEAAEEREAGEVRGGGEDDVQQAFDDLFANMPCEEEGTDFNALLDELEEELHSEPDECEARRVPGAESVRVAANRPALQMVPLPASLHPRRGREPEDEPHPEASSSAAPRLPDLVEEPDDEQQPGEQQPPGEQQQQPGEQQPGEQQAGSGGGAPEHIVLDSYVDGGDTTQIVHGPVHFVAKAARDGTDVSQGLVVKESNARAFWVIGCVTEGAVLDRLAGADDATVRGVLD
jgi:hypothetical protein